MLNYYNRYKILEPYFQDDWRVTKKLTLNLGLRWGFSAATRNATTRNTASIRNSGSLATLHRSIPTAPSLVPKALWFPASVIVSTDSFNAALAGLRAVASTTNT